MVAGKHTEGLMDLKHFEKAIEDLRKANECCAAAAMDVADVEGCIEVYQRKLQASKERLAEQAKLASDARKRVDAMVEVAVEPAILMLCDGAPSGKA